MRKLIVLIIPLIPFITAAQVGFIQEGNASFYSDSFEGRITASGERYSHLKATCAHVSIPFGSLVKITNLENNQTAIARVNDRGPFVPDRILDVSKSVAERLGIIGKGFARVRIEVIDNQGVALEEAKTQSPKSLSNEMGKVSTGNQSLNNKVANPSGSSETEYYTIDVQRQSKKGFFVQLGSFREQANLVRQVADAQDFFGKKISIQTVNANSDRFFKILVGPFSSRADAEKVRQSALSKYPGCFIVEIR